MSREFLSGNEAFAFGVRLARPQVISAYPITPQTIVVERLAEMVEDGSLTAEFVHVESEHSALSCAMGASAVGARTFTATSSQGLLYMAECLNYVSGGRHPVVMMNANRSIALPWNIYGDQRDSLALLESGWIQAYAQDAQEALDMALLAYRVAEDPRVSTPFMANLDGFHLTHTYEVVEVPEQAEADAFLPRFETENKMSESVPKNLAFTAGPDHNTAFLYKQHEAMRRAADVIAESEGEFAEIFGRGYTGLVETLHTEDADTILVTLGSAAALAGEVCGKLRAAGEKTGLLRIRYMRPFPAAEIVRAVAGAKVVAVLEKDISFGFEGVVFTNINSALKQAGADVRTVNYVGGFGGRFISESDIARIYREAYREAGAAAKDGQRVRFIGATA
ncbi:MAG: pyruvate ferredoxin oxidoreductase [Clostridiales Family XIII bacterium]|jgi:pyruvate ferredoxin oxidoreductase alpha subunit|nr:pyruvate ferredoxin oxidoreductase [Clostridiales Family XIII bacterium]